MMLFLDDAIEVLRRETDLLDDDLEIIRSELEQKCWIGDENDDIIHLILDVNPNEIASHVAGDSLSDWCRAWQAAIIMKVKRRT